MDFNAPNTGNYAIFKGEVYFTEIGGIRRHLGNVSGFDVTRNVETLPHHSSMNGIRHRDALVVVETSLTIAITIEEWNRYNVALAFLGEAGEPTTEGDYTIDLMTVPQKRGRLELIQTNDVGPRWTYDLPLVSLTPSGDAVPLIQSDPDWADVGLTAEVVRHPVTGYGRSILQGSAEAATEAATEAPTE